MIQQEKLAFVEKILSSTDFSLLDGYSLFLEDMENPEDIALRFFTSKRQRGLRLTEDGYMAAMNAKLPKWKFICKKEKNYLQFILDLTKYMPTPFYLADIKNFESEIYIFDEKISTAIMMVDTIDNFIFARKRTER